MEHTNTGSAISKQQGGFAIVVVLSSLLVLTTLFAIASQRSMTHIQTSDATLRLADRQNRDTAALTLLLELGASDTIPGTVRIDDRLLKVQDVGGLIDLNTAAPELLEALFDNLDFPPDAARDFRDWRRIGRRLQRVDDLARITGASATAMVQLEHLATVFSGRRGIAVEIAPEELRNIMRNFPGANRPDLATAPSNINYTIFEGARTLGTISIPTEPEQRRILELR